MQLTLLPGSGVKKLSNEQLSMKNEAWLALGTPGAGGGGHTEAKTPHSWKKAAKGQCFLTATFVKVLGMSDSRTQPRPVHLFAQSEDKERWQA